MTLRDLDAVMAIETNAYGFPWSRGNFIDSLAAGHLTMIAESGAAAGTRAAAAVADAASIVGYFVAMTAADEMHLLNVTVAPHLQGRGHGSRLLDAVAGEARARGLATLWLEVRAGNRRARALYARRGFAEVGLRRGYYPAAGGREDAVVMRIALDLDDDRDGLD